jgi:hypothetical protein
MGIVGFVAVVPWIQAFIWAFKPTNVVDIRYMPDAVARETEREIAHLVAKPPPPSDPPAKPVPPQPLNESH